MDFNNLTEFKFDNTSQRNVCLNHEAWGQAVTAVASSFILLGNLLVVIVLIKFPSRRFRPLNWFIVQLAVADFCVGVTVLWIGTFSAILLDKVPLISGILTYGSLASATSTSTLGILFIALDRYFYIIKHSKYKKIMTRKTVIIAISLAAIVPFCVFIIGPALGWNCIDSCDCRLYNMDSTQQYCFGEYCSNMMTPFKSETVLTGGISLSILLITSTAIYLQIFFKVHFRRSLKMHKKRRESEMRMIKTMLIVLSGFVLTTGPLAVCCIISFFYNIRTLHFVMRILVVISTVNSILNPFFYFWRIPEMNRNLRLMLTGCLTSCSRCCCGGKYELGTRRRKFSLAPLQPKRQKRPRSSFSSISNPGKSQDDRPGSQMYHGTLDPTLQL